MPNYHVMQDKESGEWVVKKEGAEHASGWYATQHEAEKAAKEFAATSGGGEVRIHDESAKIRDTDTVPPANDPYPPEDKRH